MSTPKGTVAVEESAATKPYTVIDLALNAVSYYGIRDRRFRLVYTEDIDQAIALGFVVPLGEPYQADLTDAEAKHALRHTGCGGCGG